jgi:hypothetical protein
MSHYTSDSAFESAILSICERIKSPRSLELSKQVSLGIPAKIAVDYDCTETRVFADDYFISKLLSKWKGWSSKDIQPKQAAIDNWYNIEAKNENTNKRIRALIEGSGFPGTDLITIISMAQERLQSVLGAFDVRTVLRKCKWGPGATADHRRGTYRDKKMTSCMSATQGAVQYMKILIESDPNWIEAITGIYPDGPCSLLKDFFKVQEHSRFSTVPKTYDIDRVIDMQPTANGYLQQGTGQYIRSRLRRVGIDLSSQEHNQEAALWALLRGSATVDLRNASDSIVVMLCVLLLPPDWFVWLNTIRTKETLMPKGSIRTQKFSAMGNAFTFELETLIFWAISSSVCEFEGISTSDVLCYGDDIIIPATGYEKLVYVLGYMGFEVNLEKSFSKGLFYESCGKHYHDLVDVTPIYQKEIVRSQEECVRFHNRLVRWSERTHADPWFFEEALLQIYALFDVLAHHDKRYKRFGFPRIPLGSEGDDGFLADHSEFAYDSHGGCITTVLRRSRMRAPGVRIESAYLALKLTSFRFQNSDPRGYVFEDVGRGRYELSRAYLYNTTISVRR